MAPRAAFVSLILVWIQGCAVVTAPGFDYADPSTRTNITLGRHVPADADNPPQGVITPITPEVVRSLNAAKSASRQVPPEVQSLFGSATPYTIGPGDIIGITVYGHPDLMPGAGAVVGSSSDPTGVSGAPGFIVGHDGQISFPFIGRARIAGLTEIEAADMLQRMLGRYLKEPQVSVRIASFRSRRAYVDGEVRTPGPQVFTDLPMTLVDAITRAGGLTPSSDRSQVTLMRGDRTTVIDLQQLQEAGVNPSRILLQNGDLVHVRNREDSKIYVMGEVRNPSIVPMRNGRLSLNEALSTAGGPNLLTANTGQIYVIRNTAQGSPAIYHLNARSPVALALADTFPLRPSDIVYIDPVPLVSWNRILTLILPSAGAVGAAAAILTR